MKAMSFLSAVLATAMLFAGCAAAFEEAEPEAVDAVSAGTLRRYVENEIQDYEGMHLDPAVGPRDNAIEGVQNVDIDSYTLEITGLVDTPQSLEYDEVLALDAHERVITLHCVEGWDATILWKGVRITDLIDMAHAQPEATTVIFECVDGYTTSMPLSTIEERDMLLAYESNTVTLPPEMGYPFIVVAEDKLGYKWARWVSAIVLSDDEDYEGFWEGLGYSNDADVSEE